MSGESIREQVQRQLLIQHAVKWKDCSLQDVGDLGSGRNWTTSWRKNPLRAIKYKKNLKSGLGFTKLQIIGSWDAFLGKYPWMLSLALPWGSTVGINWPLMWDSVAALVYLHHRITLDLKEKVPSLYKCKTVDFRICLLLQEGNQACKAASNIRLAPMKLMPSLKPTLKLNQNTNVRFKDTRGRVCDGNYPHSQCGHFQHSVVFNYIQIKLWLRIVLLKALLQLCVFVLKLRKLFWIMNLEDNVVNSWVMSMSQTKLPRWQSISGFLFFNWKPNHETQSNSSSNRFFTPVRKR